MKKKLFPISIAIFLLIIGFFVVRNIQKPVTKPSEKVKIGYLNIAASLPLFVAEEKGFFVEEGIEYESVPISTSNQLVDGILAGNLDLFIESSAVPVLAAEIQAPGKMKVFSVSEITSNAPFDALLVKEDSQIKTLSDFEGKKIGVFPGSTATNLLKKFLKDKGIDIDTTIFLPIPPQNHLTALMDGSVDAIHAYEPTTAIALSNGGVRKLYGSIYAEMLSPNPQGVAVVSTAFLEKNTQIAEKSIRAIEKAMIFMKEQDSETRQMLAKRMKLSEKAVQNTVFLYMLPHGQINSMILQDYANMLTDLGELPNSVQVDKLIYK